jgi:hypothetical protein
VLLDDFLVEHDFSLLDSYTLNDNVFVVRATSIPGLLQCNIPWPRSIATNFSWGGSGITRTLGGAVVEAIAQAWGLDAEAVVRSNELQREADVVVGSTGERELKARAITVNRPQE